MIKVLGIDASLRSTGWAVLSVDQTSEPVVLEVGKIKTKKYPYEDLNDTILEIAKELLSIAEQHQVSYIAIEDGFGGVNMKTSIQLARVRQGIITLLKYRLLDVFTLSPSEIRMHLMNNGSAKKEEVADYLQLVFAECDPVRELGVFCDRACKAKNSDEYDAIAAALAVAKQKAAANLNS